jgi:Fic-DOC domain mobile mystery protein B
VTDPLVDGGDDAATALSAEDRQGLKLAYVTLRRELNEAEQAGIDDADHWAFARRRDVLDERAMFGLHRRMFGRVWAWAGSRRTTNTNIGIVHHQIEVELRRLLDDVRYLIAHETFPADEIALRFHHRLTQIHPFPNGNGRFARLATDLLIVQRLGGERFSWGPGSLVETGELRSRYVSALRVADRDLEYEPLLRFARRGG